jgi:ribonucleoside-triphosphate reductase
MRTLEDVEKDLTEARDALANVEGNPAEVYSRIVGYYRSVRNWNKGKREEYGERKLYEVSEEQLAKKSGSADECTDQFAEVSDFAPKAEQEPRVLLFVRPACPACPSAKDAAGKLGIPVDMVNADTEDGLEEASRRNVFSTPTAILVTKDGKEISRALDSASIAAFGEMIAG